jgi:hypothetical protein
MVSICTGCVCPVFRGAIRKGYIRLVQRGRDFLENVLGVPVAWHFRPGKVKHFGFNVVMHNLILTRFLVAASRFAVKAPEFRLSQARTWYELGAVPVSVEIQGNGKRCR